MCVIIVIIVFIGPMRCFACAGLFGFPVSAHELEVLRTSFVKPKFGLFEAGKDPDHGLLCMFDPQPSQRRLYLCKDGQKNMSNFPQVIA